MSASLDRGEPGKKITTSQIVVIKMPGNGITVLEVGRKIERGNRNIVYVAEAPNNIEKEAEILAKHRKECKRA